MLAYALTGITLIKCKANRKWYIWPNLSFSGMVLPQGLTYLGRDLSTSSNVSITPNKCDGEGKNYTVCMLKSRTHRQEVVG